MFEISSGTKIGMSFFAPIMKATKPGAKKVNSENNKLLQPTQKFVCQETGHVLYKNQIGTYFPFGGEKVLLDKGDMKKIKNFSDQGMRLMGFKPSSFLKAYHNVRHSYFIAPDEKKSKGSSQCTDALIKELIAQDKIAIVKFLPRDNSQVRFCALVPQDEKIDGDGFQTPPGFQMVVLPFADDIRDNKAIFEAAGVQKKENEPSIVDTLSKEEKHSAKLLVKNLNIEFDSRNFENPTIQKFFSGLQALALNEEEPEPVKDLLEPDYEGLKVFDKVLGKFKETFYDGQDQDPECAGKAKSTSTRAKPAKKAPAKRAESRSGSVSRASVKSKDKKVIALGDDLENFDENLELIPEETDVKTESVKRRKLNNGKSEKKAEAPRSRISTRSMGSQQHS